MELKKRCTRRAARALPTVSGKIDAKTTIHIRGCDLGQNKEFVNLIDEAFGGKGQVIASTHEQVYGTDDVLAAKARAARKDIEDSEPMPPPVDRSIKDKAAKKQASAAHAKAVKERQARIAKAEGPGGRNRGGGGVGRIVKPCRASSCSGPGRRSSRKGNCRDRTPISASRQEATGRPRETCSSDRPCRRKRSRLPRKRTDQFGAGPECLRPPVETGHSCRIENATSKSRRQRRTMERKAKTYVLRCSGARWKSRSVTFPPVTKRS